MELFVDSNDIQEEVEYQEKSMNESESDSEPKKHNIFGVNFQNPSDLTFLSESLEPEKQIINLNPISNLDKPKNDSTEVLPTQFNFFSQILQTGFNALSGLLSNTQNMTKTSNLYQNLNLRHLESDSNVLFSRSAIKDTVEKVYHDVDMIKKVNAISNFSNTAENNNSLDHVDECFVFSASIIGEQDLVIRSKNIYECQTLCEKNNSCSYCTFKFNEGLCYHYSTAEELKSSKNTVSAPKNCPNIKSAEGVANFKNEPTQIKNNYDSSDDVKNYQNFKRKPEQVSGLLGSNLLGSVLSGSGSNILSGGLNFANTMQAASNIISTGSQFLNALPLKELTQAGSFLSEHNSKSRKGSNKSKYNLPPVGLPNPQALCHPKGMTCCIPRVNDWQKNPPYLNQYKNVDNCKSIYVSTQDALCVTSVYYGDSDQERCGVMTSEVSEAKIYRNILTVPQKSINNAICECIYNKNQTDDSAKASARWEFSVNAIEQEKTKSEQNQQSVSRFNKGVQIANILSGRKDSGQFNVGDMMSAFGNLMNK